jgi:hypothetical protein
MNKCNIHFDISIQAYAKIHPINTSYKSQRNKIADTMVSVFMISFILCD